MPPQPRTRPGARPPGKPDPTSLASSVAAYRNHADCVAAVAWALPPELTAEADPVNLPERICETRRAIRDRDPARCDEIQEPTWPAICRRLLAISLGRPDACPSQIPRARGREPSCVALASRNPALCRAVRGQSQRARCAAILGPEEACRAAQSSAGERACLRDRARWRAVLKPVAPALPATWKPTLTLTATEGPGQGAPLQGVPLEAGVVLSTRGRVTLRLQGTGPAGPASTPRKRPEGRLRTGVHRPPRARGRSATARARRAIARGAGTSTAAAARASGAPLSVALLLDVPRLRKGVHRIGRQRGDVRLCGRVGSRLLGGETSSELRAPGPRGRIWVEQAEPRRGGRLRLRFEIRIPGPSAIRLRGKLETFVRDVVPQGWLAGSCSRFLAGLKRSGPSGAHGVGGHALRGAGADGAASGIGAAVGAGAPSGRGPPCYFVAHWEGLSQIGYRVYGVQAQGACAAIGLQDGDVVTALDQKPLRTWRDVEALYERLRGAEPLVLSVRRGGKALRLRRAAKRGNP